LNEDDFKKRLVSDLTSRGVYSTDLVHGTFDILANQKLVEVKKLSKSKNLIYKKHTIYFGKPQSDEMKRMWKWKKEQPYVVVFGEEPERYYLMPPDMTAEKVRSRLIERNFRVMWITEDKLEKPGIRLFHSYEGLLKALIEFLS